MGRERKYVMIGTFGIGTVLLALATILTVGSMRLFAQDQEFVLYFDESVNGLSVGAPVKFRGVPIGQVSDIRIRYNQRADSAAIPVFGRVDTRRIRDVLGVEVDFSDRRQTEDLVKAGLRGRLQLESLITGQLFIELDYFEDSETPYRMHQKDAEYNEIPTSPSVMARVGTTTSELFARLGSIDFEELNRSLRELLENANTLVEGIDGPELSRSFVAAADAVAKFAGDGSMEELIEEAKETMIAFRRVADDLADYAGPFAGDARALMERLTLAVDTFDEMAESIDSAVSPDSAARAAFAEAMREFTLAARAMRELAEYLERNPGAILSGREPRK